MILGANGQPLASPAPVIHRRKSEWEGHTMLIELIKPWLDYKPGDRVESDPNEAQWLVRTGRGKEVKEDGADQTENS